MERETFVGIDVGTTKVVALIGEVARDGGLTIIGKGIVPASGLRKGIVVNIDQTVHSITAAVEKAERHAGYKIERAFVGVGGQHVEGLNSPGQVAVAGPRREVAQEDVNRSIEVARAVSIPSTREVLHVIPRGYTVDGQEGVMNPLGMSAVRLEVETHIVTASATAVQNLTKCVTAADVRIDELVAAGLASAEAVLSPTERDLGVAVADIGAGTIDLTLFAEGSPFHTAVLPVGGANVTNDVAIGLKTSLHVAEALKVEHGTCDLAGVDPDEVISVTVLGDEAGRTVERLDVCRIIEARMRETFEMIRTEILAAAPGMLPAGLVLTGGGAQLAGAAVLGRDVLEMPVRVAAPVDVGGLVDGLLEPGSATAIGLLLWGARHVAAAELTTYESAPGGGLLARIRAAFRSVFP
ncbi:MAG: cell division protein FtsA [Chloroflexi bacterium]|nr:cell division protein FtsA [Chloroflexota bacterium]